MFDNLLKLTTNRTSHLFVIALFYIFPSNAQADERLRLSGYYTLGASYQSGASTGIIRSHRQDRATEPGLSSGLDNVVAVQADYSISPTSSIVVQARANGNEPTKPPLRIGYLQKELDNNFKLRIGRLAPQDYADSEVANIGFANLVVRPVLPIYSKLNAVEYLDGSELHWTGNLAGLPYRGMLYIGNTEYTHVVFQDYDDLKVRVGSKWGFVVESNSIGFRLRASYSQAIKYSSRSSDITRLNSALMLLSATLPNRSIDFESYQNVLDAKPTYTSLSGEWEWSTWRVITELTALDTNSQFIGRGIAWSLIVSKSYNKFTPYVFLSRQTWTQTPINKSSFTATGDPITDSIISNIQDRLTQMQRAANLTMENSGFGLRIEIANNRALKFQAETIIMNEPFAPISGGKNGPVQLYSVTFDAIF